MKSFFPKTKRSVFFKSIAKAKFPFKTFSSQTDHNTSLPKEKRVLIEKFQNKTSHYVLDPTNNKLEQKHQTESEGIKWSIFKTILPYGYPESVTKDYMKYNLWLFAQRTISSVAYVISTHSMLSAAGISASAAVTASVATSWVLKDGLGSVGMILVADKYGEKFDINLKQSKWIADFLHVIGVAIELITPLFPKYFLLLGSIANTAKGVAGLSNGAVRASINKNLALKENLSDLTAKSFSQGLVSYLLGMGGGIGLSHLLEGASGMTYLSTFVLMGVLHTVSSYYGTNVVILRNLDRQRFDILFDHYLTTSEFFTPDEVNKREKFAWPFYRIQPDSIFLGSSVSSFIKSEEEIHQLYEHFKSDKYFIKTSFDKDSKLQLNVFYPQGRSEKDIIKSFFHCKCIMSINRWSKSSFDPHIQLESILQESASFTNLNFEAFYDSLKQKGWNLEHQLFDVGDHLIVEAEK